MPIFNSSFTNAIIRAKNKLVQIDTIYIDACKEETHTLTNTVTDHPVEQGFNVTDHSRPDPDQVTLTCLVSNTPLSGGQQQIANNASADPPDVPQGRTTIQVPDRGKRTFDALKKLRDEGTLIQVVTTLKTYAVSSTEGMMITSISVPRTAKNYDGLEFTITLKQVRIVQNSSTTVAKSKDKRVPQKQHKGSQTPDQGPPQLESKLSKSGVFGEGAYTDQ